MIFEGLCWIQGFVGMMDWSCEPQKEQKKRGLDQGPRFGFLRQAFLFALAGVAVENFFDFRHIGRLIVERDSSQRVIGRGVMDRSRFFGGK